MWYLQSLDGKKVIRAKHVRGFEDEFPGTGGIRPEDETMKQEQSSGTVDEHSLFTNVSSSIDLQSSTDSDEDSEDDSGPED